MRTYLRFLIWVLVAVPAQAGYLQKSSLVGADNGKHCHAYLHARPNSKALPLIVTLAGTGVYTTGDMADKNGVLSALIDQGKAVALTIDKPGIQYAPETTNGFMIDDAVYNQYTQRDLIKCVEGAIRWASDLSFSSPTSEIYFWGHSEGTQVVVRTYNEISTVDLPTANRVKALLLSGLVMEPWEKIVNSQLSESEKPIFWNAVKNHDDKTLRSFGDLAFAYWQDVLSLPSNKDTLKSLAERGVTASFQVYQGLNDNNTAVQPVMDFESWNIDQLLAKKSALKFSARYYNADHELNTTAFIDMLFAFRALLN